VELCLFDADSGAEVVRCDLPARSGDIWHGLMSPRRAAPGTHYAFLSTARWNPTRAIASMPPWLDRSLFALYPVSCPCARRVSNNGFDWGEDRPPAHPWRDTLIYELHVKGFTQLHLRCRRNGAASSSGLTVAP
jgi:glycogen operon protein